jgi:hypothetical protein
MCTLKIREMGAKMENEKEEHNRITPEMVNDLIARLGLYTFAKFMGKSIIHIDDICSGRVRPTQDEEDTLRQMMNSDEFLRGFIEGCCRLGFRDKKKLLDLFR